MTALHLKASETRTPGTAGQDAEDGARISAWALVLEATTAATEATERVDMAHSRDEEEEVAVMEVVVTAVALMLPAHPTMTTTTMLPLLSTATRRESLLTRRETTRRTTRLIL